MIPMETNTSTNVNADFEFLFCMESLCIKHIVLRNHYT